MQKLITQLITFLERHTWKSVALLVLLSLAALPIIKDLKVKPNFQDLLPLDSPAVRNINKLTRLYGGEGYMVAMFENAQNNRFSSSCRQVFRYHVVLYTL